MVTSSDCAPGLNDITSPRRKSSRASTFSGSFAPCTASMSRASPNSSPRSMPALEHAVGNRQQQIAVADRNGFFFALERGERAEWQGGSLEALHGAACAK